jgi:hypothetical protein
MRILVDVQRGVGVLLLFVVTGVYGMAHALGKWPPGHPFSGLALGLLGLGFLAFPLPGGWRVYAGRAITSVLALVAAVAWAWSAVEGR